jgi:hypothetical protein
MEPLREPALQGYPTDYLLARVRGRRAALMAQWQAVRARGRPAETSDEAVWEALLREYRWLREQMNPRLRQGLDPVFVLFELKTLVLCLRCVAARRRAEAERLLAHSQLADPLKMALLGASDVPSAISSIADAFAPVDADRVSLQRAYADAGLRGLEARLTRQYLDQLPGMKLRPVVRRFFASFVDLRNLMTLYKHLRWEIHDAAAFVPGGTIEVARLQHASAGKDSAALDGLVRAIAGRSAPPVAISEGALESILLGSLTRQLEKDARDGEDAGRLLEYAWRVYVNARNRAILLHASELAPALLDRELIA